MVDIIDALTPVLTTLAGGVIGFLSAWLIWKAQESRRRRNVAQGFLLELTSMEKMLTGWANVLSGSAKIKINSPLYPPTGLYHSFQKEIFAFDHQLSSSLFQFYMRVLEVERLRSFPPEDSRYSTLQKGARVALRAAVDQLPELKNLLVRETGRNDALVT